MGWSSTFLGPDLERGQGSIPKPVEVVAQLGDAVRVEPVDPPRSIAVIRDESCVLQDLEKLRDSWSAHRQTFRQDTDRRWVGEMGVFGSRQSLACLLVRSLLVATDPFRRLG